MVCGDCSSVGWPTKRTLSIFSSNFFPHISDFVAKMVARMISENLSRGKRKKITITTHAHQVFNTGKEGILVLVDDHFLRTLGFVYRYLHDLEVKGYWRSRVFRKVEWFGPPGLQTESGLSLGRSWEEFGFWRGERRRQTTATAAIRQEEQRPLIWREVADSCCNPCWNIPHLSSNGKPVAKLTCSIPQKYGPRMASLAVRLRQH